MGTGLPFLCTWLQMPIFGKILLQIEDFSILGLIIDCTPNVCFLPPETTFNSMSLYQMVQCSLRNNKASERQKNYIVSFLGNVDMKLITSVVKPCSI